MEGFLKKEGALIKVVSKKFADNSQSKDGGGGGGGVQACHFYAKNGTCTDDFLFFFKLKISLWKPNSTL